MCEGMGLPPCFAGVTFLALANGAPDVSATLAAIREGGDGLYLSLGALTGAGMFVTTVAVALVIIEAGGASMKGALLRDLLAYIGALVLVAFALSSGRLSKNFGLLLVGIYFGFVLIVLAADMWHRRIKVMSRAREITQPLVRNVSTRIRRASIALGGSGRAGAVPGAGGWAEFQGPRHGRGAYMEHVFKNLDKKKAGAGPGPVPWSRSASGRVAIADRGPPSVSPAHSLRDMQEDCSLDEEQRTTVEMGGVPAGAPDGGGGAGPSTQASSADQSGASWGGLSGVSEDLLEGGGEPGGGYGSQGGAEGPTSPSCSAPSSRRLATGSRRSRRRSATTLPSSGDCSGSTGSSTGSPSSWSCPSSPCAGQPSRQSSRRRTTAGCCACRRRAPASSC